MARITGPGGGVTMPSGFNAAFETWDATIDFGEVDVTAFEDNGYNNSAVSSCKLTANVAGTMEYNVGTTIPLPSSVFTSTFTPAGLSGSFTLTVITGCTITFTGIATQTTMSRSAKSGTKGDIGYTVVNQGALTLTWDESA